MNEPRFARAVLIPLPNGRDSKKDDKKPCEADKDAIELDFNPETLTIKVQAGLESTRGRRGRQQVQQVGDSTATLSFDAVFDTTRPRRLTGRDDRPPNKSEARDVRLQTRRIRRLIQNEHKEKKPAPRRVRFCWGNVIFDGTVQSFSETLEYFSPEGAPLRSKISISIQEQHFRYEVKAEKVTRRKTADIDKDAKKVARQNGADDLFDILKGSGFELSLDLNVELPETDGLGLRLGEIDVAMELGLGVNVGSSVGAGLDLSMREAFDVFGDEALANELGAAVDLGATSSGSLASRLELAPTEPTRLESSWAPDGPAPGSGAAELAALVHETRASAFVSEIASPFAGEFLATAAGNRPDALDAPDSTAQSQVPAGGPVEPTSGLGRKAPESLAPPTPVRGSPSLVRSGFRGVARGAIFSRKPSAQSVRVTRANRRPTWERFTDF